MIVFDSVLLEERELLCRCESVPTSLLSKCISVHGANAASASTTSPERIVPTDGATPPASETPPSRMFAPVIIVNRATGLTR